MRNNLNAPFSRRNSKSRKKISSLSPIHYNQFTLPRNNLNATIFKKKFQKSKKFLPRKSFQYFSTSLNKPAGLISPLLPENSIYTPPRTRVLSSPYHRWKFTQKRWTSRTIFSVPLRHKTSPSPLSILKGFFREKKGERERERESNEGKE